MTSGNNKTKEKELSSSTSTKLSSKVALAQAAAAAGAAIERLETAEGGEVNEIDWPYSQKTRESYLKNGLEVPNYVDYEERNFLSLVNIEPDKGGPIKREITRMVRLKARDYSSEKVVYREYLIWYENWRGKDWLGCDLPPVADRCEGMYYQQDTKKVIDRDFTTGRLLPPTIKRLGQHEEYFIPFSKEKVDEVIGDRDKNSITYTIKFPAGVSGGTGIRNNFSYHHFVNLSMEEAFKLNSKAGGSSMNPLTAANAIRSESGIT
jgi:hypothetical protein